MKKNILFERILREDYNEPHPYSLVVADKEFLEFLNKKAEELGYDIEADPNSLKKPFDSYQFFLYVNGRKIKATVNDEPYECRIFFDPPGTSMLLEYDDSWDFFFDEIIDCIRRR